MVGAAAIILDRSYRHRLRRTLLFEVVRKLANSGSLETDPENPAILVTSSDKSLRFLISRLGFDSIKERSQRKSLSSCQLRQVLQELRSSFCEVANQ